MFGVVSMPRIAQKGFTLIEMLISITVMSLIVGGGIASYMSFNEKQTVLEATNQLKAYLRKAQAQARNGLVISCTSSLMGYRLYADTSVSPVEVRIEERCDIGISVAGNNKTYQFTLTKSGEIGSEGWQ